ncbi:hypothetical protein RRF57_008425 [Xylaria bambusicola]|uniref:Uncharacterized protein n=1 Tax=Xylaria bambusicola TaxID=326684 RepID=A0AAN7UVB8_9PEZI
MLPPDQSSLPLYDLHFELEWASRPVRGGEAESLGKSLGKEMRVHIGTQAPSALSSRWIASSDESQQRGISTAYTKPHTYPCPSMGKKSLDMMEGEGRSGSLCPVYFRLFIILRKLWVLVIEASDARPLQYLGR